MEKEQINAHPSHKDRQLANEGYTQLIQALESINHQENVPEIRVLETGDPIKIPFKALKLLAEVLKNFRDGNAVSIVPTETAFTTQMTAEYLNCSRTHVVKLIDEGKLPAEKVGRHRRILFKDLSAFKQEMIRAQKESLRQLMRDAEDEGLYEID